MNRITALAVHDRFPERRRHKIVPKTSTQHTNTTFIEGPYFEITDRSARRRYILLAADEDTALQTYYSLEPLSTRQVLVEFLGNIDEAKDESGLTVKQLTQLYRLRYVRLPYVDREALKKHFQEEHKRLRRELYND